MELVGVKPLRLSASVMQDPERAQAAA